MGGGEEPRHGTGRMEAFSDGVFAIAITLLVLDLVVPSPHEAKEQLRADWPTYLAYVVSFASIGAAWVAHATITNHLRYADILLLRLNLLLLFFVSVLPFPTRMLGAYLHATDAERIGVTVYGLDLLAIAAMTSVVWRYAMAEHLVDDSHSADELHMITRKLTPSLGFYGGAILIGLLVPIAAVVLYLAIALFLLIPFRIIGRHLRRRPPATSPP